MLIFYQLNILRIKHQFNWGILYLAVVFPVGWKVTNLVKCFTGKCFGKTKTPAKGKAKRAAPPQALSGQVRAAWQWEGAAHQCPQNTEVPWALSLLLMCDPLPQRETSACPGLLPGMYLKSEGAEAGCVLKTTASELVRHSTARFLSEDLSWEPVLRGTQRDQWLDD